MACFALCCLYVHEDVKKHTEKERDARVIIRFCSECSSLLLFFNFHLDKETNPDFHTCSALTLPQSLVVLFLNKSLFRNSSNYYHNNFRAPESTCLRKGLKQPSLCSGPDKCGQARGHMRILP